MAMKTGFGRINLRTSSLIAGGISFMMVLMTLAVQSLIFWPDYLYSNDFKNENSPYHKQRVIMARSYYISCAVATILWSTVVCLLYGAYKGQRAFLIPYLVAFGIKVPVNLAFIIYVLHNQEDLWVTTLFPIICLPLTCYCLCVVGSHYIQLNPKNRQESQIQAATWS